MSKQNKCSFTWEDRGVYVVFVGEYTIEDIMKEHQHFVGNPSFDDLLYTIVDMTKANLGSVKNSDLMPLVAADFGASMSLPENLLAIVTEDPGMIQLFQFYIDQMDSIGASWMVSIQPTVEAARAWIDDEREKTRIRNLTPHPFD